MTRFEVFYNEWCSVIPGDANRERAIELQRFSGEWIKMFGPASRAECEKYTETHNSYRAVWQIREVA